MRTEKYWFPDQLPGPDESLTLDDCAELLRERIDAAVRRLENANAQQSLFGAVQAHPAMTVQEQMFA